ncbi:MAG TPA: YncE family protein [Alloacidobacterium sp.]|nr:YncE family protein [Alloacidobacterium sp.]
MNKKIAIGMLLLLSSLFIRPALTAQSTPKESLLILAKRDQTLAIVDPATLKVLKRVPVGNDPHEVIASTDGRTAYVSNYGFGAYNTLAVVDLIAQRPLPSIDLGPLRGPHGLTFVGGKTWFTAEGAKVIARYDPATKKVDWVLGTGQNRTHMIYVSPDQQHIFTTNVSSATVSIIDKVTLNPPGPPPVHAGPPPSRGPFPGPRTDWNETVVPVGKGSEGFDISPDGKELWVANAQDGTVSIIDIAAKKVTQTLAANVRGANRLKFTLDGKLVLISSLGQPDVTVIDAATHKEVKRIPVGHGSAGILIEPDGARAFVSCSPDDYVAVIDLKSLKVTGHIDAGHEPDGLAWAVQR